MEVFNANGKIFVEKMKQEVSGPGFDVHKYVTLCALDNISGKNRFDLNSGVYVLMTFVSNSWNRTAF